MHLSHFSENAHEKNAKQMIIHLSHPSQIDPIAHIGKLQLCLSFFCDVVFFFLSKNVAGNELHFGL